MMNRQVKQTSKLFTEKRISNNHLTIIQMEWCLLQMMNQQIILILF